MALSATITNRNVKGNRRAFSGTLTFDSSYPTGGEAYTAALFGLAKIDVLRLQQAALVGGAPHLIIEDKAAATLEVFVVSTGAEVANATNLSTLTVDFEVEGTL